MKFQKKKDIKRRKFYSKYEVKRIFSKYLLSQTTQSSRFPAGNNLNYGESVAPSIGTKFLRGGNSIASDSSLVRREASGGYKGREADVLVLSSLWRERLKKSHKIPRQSSKVRLRGRCLRTNRPRSVSQLLRISRQECRRLALDGQIPGVTRSSW